MSKNNKDILVTGSHRSGSTWAGRILCAAPNTAYIHEPFNINPVISVNSDELKYWFHYLDDENKYPYCEILDNIFKYKYPLIKNISKISSIKDTAKIFRDQAQHIIYRANNSRLIIKDPIALFSAEWLSYNYNLNVLVMIRHPAAFCSSLKIKNWTHDFNHFLNQPELMKKYLSDFEDEIIEYANNEKSIIDQAILLWKCVHSTINIYQAKHRHWIFVRHEDLSLDPVTQFKHIYKSFNLDFTKKSKAEIEKSTGTHNPTEQTKGSSSLLRDSKKNIKNWKNRLTEDEINYIKKQTDGISKLFYSNEDW